MKSGVIVPLSMKNEATRVTHTPIATFFASTSPSKDVMVLQLAWDIASMNGVPAEDHEQRRTDAPIHVSALMPTIATPM